MGKAHTITKTVMSILENGSRTKRMEMESYNILQEQFMTVNGSMIKHVIKDKLYTQIKINTKVTF